VSASSNCRRIRCCSPFLASAWRIWPMWHFWNTLTTQTNKQYSFQRKFKRLTKEVFETSGYVWTCECRSTKFEQNFGSTLTATFRLRPTGMESCTGQRCACNPKHLRTPTFPGHEQPSNDIFESQDPTACTRLRLVAAPTAARLTSNLSYCHDPDGNEDASKAFRNCILRIDKLMDHKNLLVCAKGCVSFLRR